MNLKINVDIVITKDDCSFMPWSILVDESESDDEYSDLHMDLHLFIDCLVEETAEVGDAFHITGPGELIYTSNYTVGYGYESDVDFNWTGEFVVKKLTEDEILDLNKDKVILNLPDTIFWEEYEPD